MNSWLSLKTYVKMKITINTEVLKKNDLNLGEFLVMLMGFYEIPYEHCYKQLVQAGLVEPNLFEKQSVVMSNNSKNLVAKILMESDDRAVNSGIDFEGLADKLREIYPDGIKAGTTYPWRATTEEIAQKLRTIVVKFNFTFTEQEAIDAVREYVGSFKDYKFMSILKNLILKTKSDKMGRREIDSLFMTIIENNKDKTENG